MSDQTAKLTWRKTESGAVPIATRFDDPYYSLDNGLAETQHVFLAGNDLPTRFCDGFHVAELGFGTGLNFLATLYAFRKANVPGRLHFTSFEAFPMATGDLNLALRNYPELPIEIMKNGIEDQLEGDDFTLSIIIGDARDKLPKWSGKADAWFLDGFSPAKNPELWDENLMHAVCANTKTNGTFATYTAAGHVRRALEGAGFLVERTPGFGRKRHMTRGVKLHAK